MTLELLPIALSILLVLGGILLLLLFSLAFYFVTYGSYHFTTRPATSDDNLPNLFCPGCGKPYQVSKQWKPYLHHPVTGKLIAEQLEYACPSKLAYQLGCFECKYHSHYRDVFTPEVLYSSGYDIKKHLKQDHQIPLEDLLLF